MSEYDSPWKEALEQLFERCVAFFFPQAHAEIDWQRGFQFLDKELQQIAPEGALGPRVVDKLVKVWRKGGEEEWVLIHIEVQSQPEAGFPRRMFTYNYRCFDKYNRMVASLAILGDDRRGWRPDSFGYSLWGCTVGLTFPAVKLLDFANDWQALEAHDNPFALIVLAHLKTQETRQDLDNRRLWKMRLVRNLFERGMNPEDVRRLFRFIDWIMDLPAALQGIFWNDINQMQEKESMPFITTPERFGRIAGLLAGIRVSLKIRFGEQGLALLPEIQRIQDHEKLEIILESIESAATLEELRRTWAEWTVSGQ